MSKLTSIFSTAVSNWESDSEAIPELRVRVEKYRNRARRFLQALPDSEGEINDELRAVELRDALIEYITAHGPDPAVHTFEDQSPDDDHTHLLLFEDDRALGHVFAVNPGASLRPEDIEEAYDRPWASTYLATDHLRFASPLFDKGSIRSLHPRVEECYEAAHLIGLTLDQTMGADPLSTHYEPERRLLQNHDYGGGDLSSL